MENYYTRMNLPQPVVPAVQALTLLKGQTALVTGANSGIGLAIAISLARAGANVIVNYVTNEEDAEAVAEESSRLRATRSDRACRCVERGAGASHVRRSRA